METLVEHELELNLVLSPERSVPVPALLSYGAHDPYAVHITFHLGSAAPVTWVFARELLVEGTFRECGQGDVRIWPSQPGRQGVLNMALNSPAGEALIEAPLTAVLGWLERTHRLVPPGCEGESLDLDGALAELLA
ncbi:SsgA family sporulation/cell division regulator [Streptomyces sp. NPDC092296]|uniref:SsgA family sporulation/cell division regulator n=1 Tax=Streptomyces sp. NPDC092296 TaxID=3366012 RepID=UPI0038046369